MAKKRGNREGTIYRHKATGKWCAQVSLGGRRLTKYFDTQKECQEWLKEINKQIDHGLTFAAANVRVSEYLTEWSKVMKHSLSPKTWVRYDQIVRDHLVPTLGKIKVIELKPGRLQFLYAEKLEAGFSPRSVRMMHAVLRGALNQAIKWGIIVRNPALAAKPPKRLIKEMKYLPLEQVEVLLAAVENTRFAALYHIAVTTGLRQGELLGLKWADLDWENRQLQIRRQLQRIHKEGLQFLEPKTSGSNRVVALGKLTIEKLKKHREIQSKQKTEAGKKWQENDLLFPSTIGTPLDPRNIAKHFENLLKEIKIPRVRFHDLRHTAATLMLQRGIHPKVVQERLGHSSISLTLDTYSHVIPSMQGDAADEIDDLLQ